MKIINENGVVFYNAETEMFFKKELDGRLKSYFNVSIHDLPSIFVQLGIWSKEYFLDLASCSDDALKFFVKAGDKEYILEIRKESVPFSEQYCIAVTADGYTVEREYSIVRAIKAFFIHEVDTASN